MDERTRTRSIEPCLAAATTYALPDASSSFSTAKPVRTGFGGSNSGSGDLLAHDPERLVEGLIGIQLSRVEQHGVIRKP